MYCINVADDATGDARARHDRRTPSMIVTVWGTEDVFGDRFLELITRVPTSRLTSYFLETASVSSAYFASQSAAKASSPRRGESRATRPSPGGKGAMIYGRSSMIIVAVVGHVEQRPVRARMARAGLAFPVPDQVDADVPGFFAGADAAATLVGNEVREARLQAPAIVSGSKKVGADDAVGVVGEAAEHAAFAAALAVHAVEEQVLVRRIES